METVKCFVSFRDPAMGEIFSGRYYEVSGHVIFPRNHIVHILKLCLAIPLYNT